MGEPISAHQVFGDVYPAAFDQAGVATARRLPEGHRSLTVLLLARLPEQTGGFEVDPTFFIATFAAGLAIGAAGHLLGVRLLVAAGVVLVMLATVVLPLVLHLLG
ncbi:hypothetical protein [Thermoleophilum album]|uniref:Uncharacterized protein n=1 Tax=Thermoleophilum album TaxID=29539 RepID=A0A1H6FMS8_THEAL|nr:hypothetical protein [Thermoleophilum album]SEH12219.1 hypothetical protein SAMN02745716_1020 [Thermoleophilum album]